ncbi:MAG TPA: winged helix-turn-helix domain-containing protein, partial [Candidatus Dormibacteraeota bacterium]
MAVAGRKSRRLLPGEDPDTKSFDFARRWLTIYEQRESLLARDDFNGHLSPDDYAAVAAGAAYWRQRTVELSGLDLDSDRRMLRPGTETEVSLTRRELELLEFLAQHPRHYFPDHVLAVRAWGERLSGDQVRIYVRRLRIKLEGTGWQISSRRGS